jgi:hypothetical protein
MSTVVPGLTDYCCVDAIAESTFLSEYYLAYRECPNTRVLAMDEVLAAPRPRFDLAANIHSFSECTLEAVEWWVQLLRDWRVPLLFIVPNEPEGILSREVDNRRLDLLPVFDAAGYRLIASEAAIDEAATRELLRVTDQFHLFALDRVPSADSS